MAAGIANDNAHTAAEETQSASDEAVLSFIFGNKAADAAETASSNADALGCAATDAGADVTALLALIPNATPGQAVDAASAAAGAVAAAAAAKAGAIAATNAALALTPVALAASVAAELSAVAAAGAAKAAAAGVVGQ